MKTWVGVILFFGIGVGIGLAVALEMLARGGSVTGAVVTGAFAGGYGTWFVFFVVLNLVRWLRHWMARA